MMSLWSPLIDSGPETVRQATFMTIGKRVPDWTGSSSSGVEQAVGGGRVEDAPAARRRAVADAGGAVLALGGDQRDVVLAVRLHLVEEFGDLGGRG